MTHYIDPRPGWLRQRTYELHKSGLSYSRCPPPGRG